MGSMIRHHKQYLDNEEVAPSASADETTEHSENELVSDNPTDVSGGIALAE